MLIPTIKPPVTTSQKNAIFVLTVIKTSNLTHYGCVFPKQIIKEHEFNLSTTKWWQMLNFNGNSSTYWGSTAKKMATSLRVWTQRSRPIQSVWNFNNSLIFQQSKHISHSQVWKVKSCSVWGIMAHVPIYASQYLQWNRKYVKFWQQLWNSVVITH